MLRFIYLPEPNVCKNKISQEPYKYENDHVGSVIVLKHFQILNMNEKCSDRYNFQINRIGFLI
jgi:hypothetical protein